jgi:hypothetical protein
MFVDAFLRARASTPLSAGIMRIQGLDSAVQTSRRRVGKSGRRAASRANGAWRSLLLAGTCAAAMVARAAGQAIPSFELVDISAKISSDDKFTGAAVVGDGRVVFAPRNADGVGVFDPTDDSFTLVDISATISSDNKFSVAAVAGDGRVVFVPYFADGVGVFFPPPGTDWCNCCESQMMTFGFSVGRVCVLPPP